MRGRTAASLAWTVLLLAGPVRRAPAAEGDVRLVRLDAETVEGAFGSVSAEAVTIAGHDPVPLGEVVEVRFPARPGPKAAREGVALRVHLRGGEVLAGALVAGDSEGITLRPPDLPEVRLPFDWIRRVETDEGSADPCAEPARGRPPREGADVVHSRTGDAFPGTLVAATEAGVVVETARDRRQTIPWADVVVLHLDEPPLPAPAGLAGEVETAGGSRLSAVSVSGDAKTLKVETPSGLKVDVPVASVAALRWSGGSFVYACELPYESSFEPYYGDDAYEKSVQERWYGGARSDRRRSGCPIRLGGTTYRHGIAVHSKSVVTVPLGKAYRSFSAVFGIDDEDVLHNARGAVGWRGDVTARVLADGKEIWSSKGSVRGGEPPRTVGPLPVEGVETLSLEVGYGEEHHANDLAAWADPILVRAAR